MNRHRRLCLHTAVGVAALGGVLAAGLAFAQEPGGPPPSGPGGPPPGPGFGGFVGFGARPASAADAPLDALAAGLGLSADQKTRIAGIQKQVWQQRREAMPRPGGQPGAPPDPDTMRAAMDKLRGLEQAAARDIDAALTSDQKQILPTLLKEIDALRMADIPAELYGTLKLSSDQKQEIAGIVRKAQDDLGRKMDEARQNGDFGRARDARMQSRKQTHDQAMAVLTDAQRRAVEKFVQEHPRPSRGGGFGPPPGGFGPPPGGGPPPPDGPDDPNKVCRGLALPLRGMHTGAGHRDPDPCGLPDRSQLHGICE